MQNQIKQRTLELLRFLGEFGNLRHKRISTYGNESRILWFADLPQDLPPNWTKTFMSVFSNDNSYKSSDVLLEVHKKRKPVLPPLPDELKDWVSQDFQKNPEKYINKKQDELLNYLNEQITVLIDKPGQDITESTNSPQSSTKEPVVLDINDYPRLKKKWESYLKSAWIPWANEMRFWKKVQDIYETVDFMRRRIEEAQERFEIIIGLGFLQWKDSKETIIRRHLLTAPVEIDLDSERGILTVSPSESCLGFRIELDMFDFQDRPDLEKTDIKDRINELGICVWERKQIAEILRIIANNTKPDAQVYEDEFKPFQNTDNTVKITFSPAIVLRERFSTGYNEMIMKIIECYKNGNDKITSPWKRLICEGKGSDEGKDGDDEWNNENGRPLGNSRLYFPLPTNNEQRQIVKRLNIYPYVLVKGPPGTGKSHTIANLICHLLATNQRILVTAHAPKALMVLRGLLPEDIANLCVTALGSSREDNQFLKNCIREIINKKNSWQGTKWAETEINQLENQLAEIDGEIVRIERQIRECREKETYRINLPSGYAGTAGKIARQLEEESKDYNWFPDLPDDDVLFPLEREEIAFFADYHTSLTQEKLNEINLDVGSFSLITPEDFNNKIEELEYAERKRQESTQGFSDEELKYIQNFSETQLEKCKDFLLELDAIIFKAHRAIGDLLFDILKDFLCEQINKWDDVTRNILIIVEKIQTALNKISNDIFSIPRDVDNVKMLNDCKERCEYFKNNRWRGWWILVPHVVRKTQYIEDTCLINGEKPCHCESLEKLIVFLELRDLINQYVRIFPKNIEPGSNDPKSAAIDICSQVEQLNLLVNFLKESNIELISPIPHDKKDLIIDNKERKRFCLLIEAGLSIHAEKKIKFEVNSLLKNIESQLHEKSHPCVVELVRAVKFLDRNQWKVAYRTRENLLREKESYSKYREIKDKLEKSFPHINAILDKSIGNPEWKDKLLKLKKAWSWASARAWLKKVSNPDYYQELLIEREKLQLDYEKKIKDLATIKAWNYFFLNLDGETEQNLIAWSKAVARIGKGTGKYALKHRRKSQQYLMKCINKIPAWVMPLHKIWQTIDAKPELYDTIIIDEASQAGIDALILFLLGKRVIVVGDDKQNSPEAVGVLEDDIARLIRNHLKEFHFRDEYRPDTSLYDHAERAFGNVIPLREHFRCVPEIIRFSNKLCYEDAPLIPLRQPPPKRLEPLKTVFIPNGYCEGESTGIINKNEAEEVVQIIQECIKNPDYKDKTMGVIILQGHAQAELIERRLAEELEPKVREERKIRCGVPATFQGDQRDVIFLSLVTAPNHNFRALTGLSDQRRFNVAMSRARDQVWLLHSVQLSDLSRECLRWKLLNFFYNSENRTENNHFEEVERLEREIRGRSRYPGSQPDPYDSWFEIDVALELLKKGYKIRPQVDTAGYRIDLVIEGISNRLAIECDGEIWHGPERFEYDILRQKQLERVGWIFYRVRESEFYANRTAVVNRIVEMCDERNIHPIT